MFLPTRTFRRGGFLAFHYSLFLALTGALVSGQAAEGKSANLPRIATQNNTAAAGVLRNGVLDLNLEILNGDWYPQAEDGPHVAVYAFAEKGKAPSIPGPLIRVPEGTQIKLRIHNALTVQVKLHGFNQRPTKDEAVTVAAGEERELDFAAGAPGTYFYWASSPDDSSLAGLTSTVPLDPAPSQLTGAFIVDGPGEPQADRVFVIGMWEQIDDPKSLKDVREFGTINGKSWPYTEGLRYKVGDTVHMRWINASSSNHPMHMHGSYYRLDGTSDGESETVLPADLRPMIATNFMTARTAMEMTWQPERPGNWLFHCHILAHVVESAVHRAGSLSAVQSEQPMQYHEHGAPMVGLAMGIKVDGGSVAKKADYSHARKMTLAIQEVQASPTQIRADVVEGNAKAESNGLMGPPIVLHRGEPVEITVENHMPHETAIHWHGIELESYYDGVPEFSGMGKEITPPISPGGKFVVRFTPPRAGTFIYHTHWHDVGQLSGGLYGPLIVLDPGQSYDPATDLAFVAGGSNQNLFVNGQTEGAPLHWRAGQRYHVRLINIMVNTGVLFSLSSGGAPVRWQAVAKDGMTLPAAQRAIGDAKVRVVPGETYDFEVTPTIGDLVLRTFRRGASNLIEEKTVETTVHVE
jgi:FtsP/CotA-like multicopper oxidase with cupredoxin domain